MKKLELNTTFNFLQEQLQNRDQANTLAIEIIEAFQNCIYEYYHDNRRDLPWRETSDPYAIFVSEVMLQQTQAGRVIDKYNQFLAKFPTVESLASGTLAEVLTLWQGLGYNRRAQALHKAAQVVARQYANHMPATLEELQKLPGIGSYTAAAICAFAYNQPVMCLETNIRRVFIHFFFDDEQVDDKRLIPLIEQTVDHDNPREWYYALMDYGAMLGKTLPNANKRSKHYTVQSKFTGSLRQARGAIIRILTSTNGVTLATLQKHSTINDERFTKALHDLMAEQLVSERAGLYYLGSQGVSSQR